MEQKIIRIRVSEWFGQQEGGGMKNGVHLRGGLALILGAVILTYQNCAYVGAPGSDPNQVILSNLTQGLNTDAAQHSASLEKNALAVLNTRCASCHNPSNPKGDIGFIMDVNSLKYYRLVVPGEPQLSPLYEVIAQGEMPPSGPLAQAQVQMIYDWIFEGMLTDQAGVTPPVGTAGVLEAKFQSVFVNIIQPKCLGCHNSTTSSGGLDLSTHTKVLTTVTPNNPTGSAFYDSVSKGRMPKGRPMLSASELTAVRDWITNGALNN